MRSLSRVMMSVLVGYVLRSRYVKILLDLNMKVCQICSAGLWWHVFVAFELPTKDCVLLNFDPPVKENDRRNCRETYKHICAYIMIFM